MALKKQTISIPFRLGLGRGSDQAAEGVPGFVQLQNGVYNLEGAVRRRHGFRRVVDAGIDAIGLVHANGKLGVVSGTALKAYDPEASWAEVASIATDNVTTDVYDRIDHGYNVLRTDIAFLTVSGTTYLGVVSVERNDNSGRTRCFERYYNYTTGTRIYSGEFLVVDTQENCRGARIEADDTNDRFIIVNATTRSGTSAINFRNYNPATNTFGSTVQVTNTADMLESTAATNLHVPALPAFDTAHLSGTTYVAWINAGTSRVNIAGVSPTAVTLTGWVSSIAPRNDATTDEPSPLALIIHGSTLVVGYTSAPAGAAVTTETVNPASLASIATATNTVVAGFLSQFGTMVFTRSGADEVSLLLVDNIQAFDDAEYAPNVTYKWPVTVSTNAHGSRVDYNGIQVLSKNLTGTNCALVSAGPNTYSDVFLFDFTDPERVIRRIVFEHDASTIRCGLATRVVAGPSGEYAAYLPDAIEGVGARQDESFRHLGVVRVSRIETEAPLVTTRIQDAAYLGGTLPRVFTGREVVEAAPLGPPPPVEEVQSAAGSSHAADTNYSYVVVATYSDELGRLHTSPPSPPIVDTNAAPHDTSVTGLYHPPAHALASETTARRRLHVYRTEGDGSVYYLLHSSNLNSAFASANFEDEVTDATLSVREGLYTDAELASEPCPPAAHLWTHRNRMFALREDQRTQARFTKECVLPEAPQWNVVLQKNAENAAGDIIAGASLGGGLVLFQASQILAFAGEGPTDTGADDSFTFPEVVAQGIGARDRVAVLSVPGGVIFRSAGGFYLTSGGEPSFIGEPVRELEQAMGDTTAAAYLPALNQSWFAGEDESILVYDHTHARWSSFTFPGVGYVAGIVELGGEVYTVRRDGEVFHYDTSTYMDYDGSSDLAFDLDIGLPWFRPAAGFAGDFRVWKVFLELFAPAANPTTGVIVNTYTYQPHRQVGKGSEVSDGQHTFLSTQVDDLPAGLVELRFRPRAQRASAFRAVITVRQVGTDETAEGLRVLGIKYEYGVRAETSGSPTTPGQVS